MLVFLLANLPLPLILFLNLHVTLKFLRVRKLARHRLIKKPGQLVIGWWLGNISMVFAFMPAIWEHRLFVQNRWWLISYTIGATLSISGLLLMDGGLGQELRVLSRRKHRKRF